MDSETREMFGLIISRLDKIDSRFDAMESRQVETFQIVKAIEHANQVHKAEIDRVKVMTDFHEGTFTQIGNVINSRKAVNQD
jgi:hypothetical protein